MKQQRPDHYATLEVSRTASAEELRRAYKRLALRWHPDKNPQQPKLAEEKFKLISEAYQVLSDAGRRRRYDAGETQETQGFADARDFFSHFAADLFTAEELDFFGLQRGRGSRVEFGDDFFREDDGPATTQTRTRKVVNGQVVEVVTTNVRGADGSLRRDVKEFKR